MEIEYKNSIEEIEKIVNYSNKDFIKKFGVAKYIISLIPVISGVRYLILENRIKEFIVFLIMSPVVFFILNKLEPKFKNTVSKRLAKKITRKNNYFLAQKKLYIKDSSIIINYNDMYLEMKLNKNIVLDTIDGYVTIIDLMKLGYKYKLIIPNNAFKNENEKETFINVIKEKINV